MGPLFGSTGYKLNSFSIKKSSAQSLVCIKIMHATNIAVDQTLLSQNKTLTQILRRAY